jgi:para-nitrobenzyl esterase
MPFGLRAVCALAIAAGVPAVHLPGRANPLLVRTEQGRLHGKYINNRQVRAFLGIPYAAPPVKDLRWRPPQEPEWWSGVRDATRYEHRCMQARIYADMEFQDSGPSEDCLYLNVFTPAKAGARKKLPVMFWIHGGGFQAGSASEPRHDGAYLPLQGVVLVTINYRLGVFGFLATPGLGHEDNGAAGNYGLMDQVAALKWVHTNIRAFGGNPDNVTIFGESAGSESVCALMAATDAQQYFQKAIGESGALMKLGAPGTLTLRETEERDQAWAEKMGAKTPTELRALPAEKLLNAALKKGAPRFRPVIDGRLLIEPVAATYAAGRQAHIPLLAGWNEDENTLLAESMTAQKWREFAEDRFGDRADEFLQLFPGDTDDEAAQSAIAYGSATFIALDTWRWIEAQRRMSDAPVYRYHFELDAPPSEFHQGGHAFHSDEIEYVFGTLRTRPGAEWRPEDLRLSDVMMTYWSNFARHGNPNGPGAPDWPPYNDDNLVIHLKRVITVGASTVRAQYEFLREVLPPTKQ